VRNGIGPVARRRLDETYEAAKRVVFDDSSRIIFFSDSHRGDNSRSDVFRRNEGLFLRALGYYYRQGFTYVEVGDGDELWKNRRFEDVRRAHGRVFDLFHAFAHEGRLQLVYGNHDIDGNRHDPMDKDGIPAHEGVLLRHARTKQQIFVVHGHQVDFLSDRMYCTSRVFVRLFGDLQRKGLGSRVVSGDDLLKWADAHWRLVEWLRFQTNRIEQRIVAWLQRNRQVVICGHTHRARCAAYGAPPYFNCGSCSFPGCLTGLELQNGALSLVRWIVQQPAEPEGTPRVVRELLTSPRRLPLFV
jgi:UDP-2,3-diacylglucosamine pyrophosphatase LpxH